MGGVLCVESVFSIVGGVTVQFRRKNQSKISWSRTVEANLKELNHTHRTTHWPQTERFGWISFFALIASMHTEWRESHYYVISQIIQLNVVKAIFCWKSHLIKSFAVLLFKQLPNSGDVILCLVHSHKEASHWMLGLWKRSHTTFHLTCTTLLYILETLGGTNW